MRQLSYVDIASLMGKDWVAEVGARFAALKMKKIFIIAASQTQNGSCTMRADAHKIVHPSAGGSRRGTLPDFQELQYRWKGVDGKCCDSLEVSGECSKLTLTKFLAQAKSAGVEPGTHDLTIFFHEPT